MALMTQVGLEFIARNKANRQISSFNRSIRRMGGQLLAIAGFGGGLYMLQRGFGGIIQAASDAEEIQSKFNVVFGHTAVLANEWAETFGDAVGRATQDVQSWMATLQDTFVPLGFARERAFELSKTLATLAVDVASFNNAADADVIRDFTSALVGNHETVRKYGIIIGQATMEQEALNRGWDKSYKQLTDMEKVQLRLSLIQKGSTDAQGDALRTAGSYANQIKRLSANFLEFKTGLGEEVLPTLTSLIKKINEHQEGFDEWLRGMREGFLAVKEVMMWLESHGPYMMPPAILSEPTVKEKFMAGRQAEANRLIAAAEEFHRIQIEMAEEQIEQIEKATMEADDAMAMHRIEMLQKGGTLAAMEYRKDIEAIEQQMIIRKQIEDKQMQAFVDKTRSTLESVRNMHELTRNEKIQYLQDYETEHAAMLMTVVDAERFVTDEIVRYQRARVDALKVYYAGLREDVQDSALYLSEKWANLAMNIEGSMSNAFYSMIAEGASFRDAMTAFAQDIARAFSRMLADIAARQMMGGFTTAFGFGGAGGGGGGQTWSEFKTAGPGSATFQHGGMVAKTGWAEVHKGETFSGVNNEYGGAGAPVVVNINNQTGVPMKQKGPARFDGREWVIGIVTENFDRGAEMADMIQGRRG